MTRWLFALIQRMMQTKHSSNSAPAGPNAVLMQRIQQARKDNAELALQDQMVDIYQGQLAPPPPWTRYSLRITVVVIVTFTAWAALTTLDEVTSASGKVIPTSREQVIQSMESGLVAQLMVTEGQVVEEGQPLIRIDDVRLGSNMQESQGRVHALQAAASRLKAESLGLELQFSADLVKANPLVVRSETDTYNARRRALESNLSSLQQTLKLSQDELKMTEPLADRGLVSDIEVIRIQRSLAETRGKITDLQTRSRAEASAELARVEADLASQRATLTGRADAFRRTVLKAPKRGIVKNIRVTTVGAVIQSGQELLEIVPLDENLLIEARIRPIDIAFLRPGLAATVKITAYDSGIYGWLEGELIQISPDTLRDEVKRDETFYRAMVKTKSASLQTANGTPLPIIPGMQAVVDIKTGQKSVLSYLFKPVLRMREAFRER
jgi:adhesin transport system membrane fusion protein